MTQRHVKVVGEQPTKMSVGLPPARPSSGRRLPAPPPGKALSAVSTFIHGRAQHTSAPPLLLPSEVALVPEPVLPGSVDPIMGPSASIAVIDREIPQTIESSPRRVSYDLPTCGPAPLESHPVPRQAVPTSTRIARTESRRAPGSQRSYFKVE
jgi:hypothetical protein